MRRMPLLVFLAVTCACFSADAWADDHSREPERMVAPGRPLADMCGGFHTTAVETTLASWTFDDWSGAPDAQGWTMVDRTAQIGLFFHVDDFASMAPPWLPLSGTKSLWCGARPCGVASLDDLCSYATLPGYGNNWDQRFQSTSFAVTGDVSIAFDIRYDVEPSYDSVSLEYSTGGSWVPLQTFTGNGIASALQTVPAGNHSGSIRFRFRVQSDGVYSDEDGLWNTDGAAIIDNVVVTDDGGVVDSQNFETEPVNFLFTSDFDWYAQIPGQYGLHAGLFDGDAVLQEDSGFTNSTNLWGFFRSSAANYACGGHPEQAVVPFGHMVDGSLAYIRNEIRSPEVVLTGVTPGSPVKLDFDVYPDMPLDNLVFYEFRVRSKVGGAWKRWRSNGIVYYRADKTWFRHRADLASLVEVGATSIQVAIGARDMCAVWCGINGSGACHSQGPLIDNVSVVVPHDEFVVTNTNDAGPGSLRQAITDVNATTYGGIIRFDIPGTGPFNIALSSSLAAIRPVIIDGTTQPGYSGTPFVHLDGLDGDSGPVITVSGGNSQILGLHVFHSETTPFGTGITLFSDFNSVNKCIVSGCTNGIQVSGNDNRIGGTGEGDGNIIHNMAMKGVLVVLGERNRISSNAIYDVFNMPIDLVPIGPNPNDPLDADSGVNRQQNHPDLTGVSVGAFDATIDGTLSSTPNTTFRVEYFLSDACSPSSWQTYYGFSYIATDGSGNAAFSEYFAAPMPSGAVITATVTDPLGNTSEFSGCLQGINTPAGSNAVANPIDPASGSSITLTYDQVTVAGNSYLTISPSGPSLPGGFDLGNGLYYDVSTTATFTGNIEVCISYDEGALQVPEAGLRLLHYDENLIPPDWVDVTSSLDVGTNVICGTTDHFSPFVLAAATPTAAGGPGTPRSFALRQNVPNPFNPSTTISYDVPSGGADVTIRIYDVSGRLVRTLVDARRPAGVHEIAWDGRDASGRAVATGVYFYRMVAGSFTEARRMVLLK